MEIYTFLQEASVSVVSIGALVYVTFLFIKQLDQRTKRHEQAMTEREHALRELEREVRQTLTEHVVQSNITLNESNKVISRAVEVLDKK